MLLSLFNSFDFLHSLFLLGWRLGLIEQLKLILTLIMLFYLFTIDVIWNNERLKRKIPEDCIQLWVERFPHFFLSLQEEGPLIPIFIFLILFISNIVKSKIKMHIKYTLKLMNFLIEFFICKLLYSFLPSSDDKEDILRRQFVVYSQSFLWTYHCALCRWQ